MLSVWLIDVIKAAAQACSPPLEMSFGDHFTNEVVDLGSANVERPRCLVFAQYPSRWLIDAIARSACPVVAIAEDPIDAVTFLIRQDGANEAAAMRAQSAAATAVLALRSNPAVIFVDRSTRVPTSTLIAAVLRHLRLPLAKAELLALIEHFVQPFTSIDDTEDLLAHRYATYAPPQRGLALSPYVQQGVAAALDPLYAWAHGQGIEPLRWPAQLQFNGTSIEEPAPSEIDLTGPARILFRGPLLHLPPGAYRLRVDMAFSYEAMNLPFALEAFGRDKLAEFRFTPPTPGRYAIELELALDDPAAWLDLRLSSAEGAIDGAVGLLGVEALLLQSADGRFVHHP